MLLDRSPLTAVDEGELDILILTALHASPRVRAVFADKVAGLADAQFLGAWRSVCANGGESDIVAVVAAPDGQRTAIMIEDKINAPLQYRQAERYRERGELGITLGDWDAFYTCLCAPEAYAAPYKGSKDWDAVLTLEDLEAALPAPHSAPEMLLCQALRAACGKLENPKLPPNAAVTAFWQAYATLCAAEYPDLRMSSLSETQTVNDPWARFARTLLPANVLLEHKAWLGRIDMTFKGVKAEDLRAKIGPLLPPCFDIPPASGSAILRLKTASVDSKQPLEAQAAQVRAALDGARTMLGLWATIAGAAVPAA